MTRQERWMPGRESGRPLYIHRDGEECGELVGIVDTPEPAVRICGAMNAHPAPPRRPLISPAVTEDGRP